MRKIVIVVVCVLGCSMADVAQARGTGFGFRAGLSYLSAFLDIVDLYKDEFNLQDEFVSPVGLQFNARYAWVHGSRVDATLGPGAIIMGDADYYDVPITFTYGFTAPPHTSFGIYGRAGVAIHIVGGDLDPQSSPGFIGYVGAEFLRHRRVGFGFEIGYDTTKVEFSRRRGTEELDAHGVIVSAYARF